MTDQPAIKQSTIDTHFAAMWQAYIKINSNAKTIHQLFSKNNPQVVNDHIALRTYDLEPIKINALAKIFVRDGYVAKENYIFDNKHLQARYFAHEDLSLPKIFISSLQVGALSKPAQVIIQNLVAQVPASQPLQGDFCYSGRPWKVSYTDYKKLLHESEYAAWLAAFGFIPNHFTVSINHLQSVSSLVEVNELLKINSFTLNISGGEIKGSPQDLLEQSSTLAKPVAVKFTDSTQTIPGCYYEFARRYKNQAGQLFQGFVTQSADKIFESTDTKLS